MKLARWKTSKGFSCCQGRRVTREQHKKKLGGGVKGCGITRLRNLVEFKRGLFVNEIPLNLMVSLKWMGLLILKPENFRG